MVFVIFLKEHLITIKYNKYELVVAVRSRWRARGFRSFDNREQTFKGAASVVATYEFCDNARFPG